MGLRDVLTEEVTFRPRSNASEASKVRGSYVLDRELQSPGKGERAGPAWLGGGVNEAGI